TGQLVSGRATVTLDPDYAALVETGDYHVFVTPRDAACKGLAVVAQSASSVTVQELHGGTSSGTFSYRVVARPKSEKKTGRLAKYTIPAPLTLPDIGALTTPAKMPTSPNIPTPPTPPQAAPPPRPAAPA